MSKAEKGAKAMAKVMQAGGLSIKDMEKGKSIRDRLLEQELEKMRRADMEMLLLSIIYQSKMQEVTIYPGVVENVMSMRRNTPEGQFPKIQVGQEPGGNIKLKLLTKDDYDEMWEDVCHQHWFAGDMEGGYAIEYKHKETGHRKVELWKNKGDYDEGKDPDDIMFQDIAKGPHHLESDVREYFRGNDNA